MGFVCVSTEILGFAEDYREQSDTREIFYLRDLCVRPEFQGRGVGSRPIRHLEEVLQEMGVNLVYLITYRGGQAEAFYKKHRYRINSEEVVMSHEW